MAHPSDPRNAADPSAFGLANARLTLEEAERLAATFRPSWQVDEVPASDASFQGRQSGGGPADQRAAVQALNGNYPPAPATVRDELDRSVIIDPAIAPPVAAPPPAAPMATVPSVQTRTVVMPTMGGVDPRLRGPGAVARGAGTTVPPRRSLDFSETEFPKRTRKGLWVGLAAVLAAVIGVGVWTLSGSSEKAAVPASAPPQNAQTVETRAAAAPPHPLPEAPPAPAPPPVPQAPPPPAPLPTAATPPTVAAPPPPPPVAATPAAPRIVVPPAPRPPTWTPPPAARPAPRPKPPGATIVRDVPF